jgi:hypothetical protein
MMTAIQQSDAERALINRLSEKPERDHLPMEAAAHCIFGE